MFFKQISSARHMGNFYNLLMVLLLGFSANVIMAQQEYGDACYRKLQMLGGQYDCSHAAIYIGMDSSGQHWILEQSGITSGIQTAWFSDMTDNVYYGSYTSSVINPSFSTRRSIVQEKGLDLLARSANIGYTWQDCLEPVNAYTSPIDTWEIQNLRCDGFVEFCYEAAGVDSWGKNGGNFSITTHHAEHNNFFEHGWYPNSDTELCPCVQHGRVPGNSARLTRPSVIDAPVCNLTYVQHDGYTYVTITATDRSGIHRIRYSRAGIDSDWQDGPATGLHCTSDSLTFTFSISSSCDVYAYAIDKAGNKPYSAPGIFVPVDRIPLPPEDVAASDDSFSNKIRIVWDASEGATSYEIWRNNSSNTSSAERIATPDSITI